MEGVSRGRQQARYTYHHINFSAGGGNRSAGVSALSSWQGAGLDAALSGHEGWHR